MLFLPGFSASNRRKILISPNGQSFTDQGVPGDSNCLLDLSGNSLSVTQLSLASVYRGAAARLDIRTNNLQVSRITSKPKVWSNRCDEESQVAPFRGGRQDTLYIIRFSYTQAGEFRIGEVLLGGPITGTALEFFGPGNCNTGIQTANGIEQVLGQGIGEIFTPRIISVRRFDGQRDTGGDIPIINKRYYCEVPFGPTWTAGNTLSGPSNEPRVAQGVFSAGEEYLFNTRPNNPSQRWNLEIRVG